MDFPQMNNVLSPLFVTIIIYVSGAGVYDALQKKYLKSLFFCICENEDGPMIEEYACNIRREVSWAAISLNFLSMCG